jgi:hypothetical protein
MKHQPFEDWLLNDKVISPEQKRELDSHLRTCAYCSALAETGIALKSVKMVSPREGFANRFQIRLVERKLADHRRRFWGAILFTFGGLVLLLWLTSPYLFSFFASPAAWISSLVELGVYFITTIRALAEAGFVVVDVIPSFLSPFMWMVLFSTIAGISLLWSVSIWRFTRVPQGV